MQTMMSRLQNEVLSILNAAVSLRNSNPVQVKAELKDAHLRSHISRILQLRAAGRHEVKHRVQAALRSGCFAFSLFFSASARDKPHS